MKRRFAGDHVNPFTATRSSPTGSGSKPLRRRAHRQISLSRSAQSPFMRNSFRRKKRPSHSRTYDTDFTNLAPRAGIGPGSSIRRPCSAPASGSSTARRTRKYHHGVSISKRRTRIRWTESSIRTGSQRSVLTREPVPGWTPARCRRISRPVDQHRKPNSTTAAKFPAESYQYRSDSKRELPGAIVPTFPIRAISASTIPTLCHRPMRARLRRRP